MAFNVHGYSSARDRYRTTCATRTLSLTVTVSDSRLLKCTRPLPHHQRNLNIDLTVTIRAISSRGPVKVHGYSSARDRYRTTSAT
ncbi:hypothetical protein J6590_085663 [Homalodisca vitripennis]|nr:hypothetical protein J6590_085663 [Homalodisca vitripennis]